MTESDDRPAAVGVAAGWSGFARLGLSGRRRGSGQFDVRVGGVVAAGGLSVDK